MIPIRNSKSFRRFAKHVFVISRVYAEKRRAKEIVYQHLQKMRRSIIKMRLSYSDIDRLKEKIDNLLHWERKYAKFFKSEDNETEELKNQIQFLEQELKKERQEKQRIIDEDHAKINQLTGSLSNIKGKMNELLLDKTRRNQRVMALDKKIREKIDVHQYYHHG